MTAVQTKELQPHQLRVVNEHDELKDKVDKLVVFIDGDFFKTLDKGEQERLLDQNIYMAKYLEILKERINNF